MSNRMKCYGCRNLNARSEGDGGTTYLCNASPGLVLGSINLVERDEPFEADKCHSSRQQDR